MKMLKDIAISSIITTVVMLVLNASWDWVFIASLEVAVLASAILAGMLKGAISLEKVMAAYFLASHRLHLEYGQHCLNSRPPKRKKPR